MALLKMVTIFNFVSWIIILCFMNSCSLRFSGFETKLQAAEMELLTFNPLPNPTPIPNKVIESKEIVQ